MKRPAFDLCFGTTAIVGLPGPRCCANPTRTKPLAARSYSEYLAGVKHRASSGRRWRHGVSSVRCAGGGSTHEGWDPSRTPSAPSAASRTRGGPASSGRRRTGCAAAWDRRSSISTCFSSTTAFPRGLRQPAPVIPAVWRSAAGAAPHQAARARGHPHRRQPARRTPVRQLLARGAGVRASRHRARQLPCAPAALAQGVEARASSSSGSSIRC